MIYILSLPDCQGKIGIFPGVMRRGSAWRIQEGFNEALGEK
jgi:hypothetical protein